MASPIARDCIRRAASRADIAMRPGMQLIGLLAVLLAIYCNGVRAQSSAAAGADLHFVGIVTGIAASPIAGSNNNWVVLTTVEKIESGSFPSKTFSFRVHSPARSGLAVGRRYHFHALRTDHGYAVKEFEMVTLK